MDLDRGLCEWKDRKEQQGLCGHVYERTRDLTDKRDDARLFLRITCRPFRIYTNPITVQVHRTRMQLRDSEPDEILEEI